MNYQCFGITDVGEVRDQPQTLDELRADLSAAFDAEGHDRASAVRQIFLLEDAIRTIRQRRKADPSNIGMLSEKSSHRFCISNVTLHPDVQRFQTLQKE